MKIFRGHIQLVCLTLLVACVDPVPLQTDGNGGEQGSMTTGGKGGQSRTGGGGPGGVGVGGGGAAGSGVGGKGPSGGGPGGSGASGGGPGGQPGIPLPPVAPMGPRALSQREIANTFQTLTGGTFRALKEARTPPLGWMQYDRDPSVGFIDHQTFELRWELAAKFAPSVLMNANLPQKCDAFDSGGMKCYDLAIRTLIPLILRRESSEPMVQSLIAFAKTLDSVAPAAALSTLVATMLRLPEFLFITHHDRGGDGPRGNPYLSKMDLATRLSFLITGTTPTVDWTATFDGSPQNLSSVSRDLSAKSGGGLESFFEQWFLIDRVLFAAKDPRLFPKWEAEKASVLAEGIAFLSKNGFSNENSFWPDLLTSPVGDDRRGFLMQRWFLATHAGSVEASPTQRGMFIRDRILCEPTPPPPPDFLPVVPGPQNTNATYRERLASVTGGGCAGCHQMIDPIGFGLEHYDAAGLFRTMDNGKPIDASGHIALDSNIRMFNGANELVTALAGMPETGVCFVRNFTSFVFGYSANVQNDELVTALAAALATNLGARTRLRDMLQLVVTSVPFRTIEAKNIFPERSWPRPNTVPQPGKLDLASMEYVLNQFRAFQETARSHPIVMQIDNHIERLREMERRLSVQ